MYRNIAYLSREGVIRHYTWNEHGERITLDVPYRPYLYYESGDPNKYDAISIFGTKLTKKTFPNDYERSKWVQNSGITRIFHNFSPSQQYLIDNYWSQNESADFQKFALKYCFLDIEVYAPGDFPEPEQANEVIDLITVFNSESRIYTTFGLKPLTKFKPPADVKYVLCKNESDLLEKFVEYMEYEAYDIISHYNGETFDIPYLVNRITKILGEPWAKRLSPVGRIRSMMSKNYFGQTQQKWTLEGTSSLDMLDLYKKYTFVDKPSFKLDYIANLELGTAKTDYGDISLAQLSDENWDLYVEYNIQDVRLLDGLENKLKLLQTTRSLATLGLCNLQIALGTVSVVNGAGAIRAMAHTKIIPTFVVDGSDQRTFPGAYVAEPKQGFATHIMSFDANSLYPSCMMDLNLSPETKFGRIIEETEAHKVILTVSGKRYTIKNEDFLKFLQQANLSCSAANILFSQKTRGVLPELLEYYYGRRVSIKGRMKDIKRELAALKEDIKKGKISEADAAQKKHDLEFESQKQDLAQFVLKNFLASVFGYTGNKHAALGDVDIAHSITATGQSIIKACNRIGADYIENQLGQKLTDKEREDLVIYNDTDSVIYNTNIIVNNQQVQIGDFFKQQAQSKIQINDQPTMNIDDQVTILRDSQIVVTLASDIKVGDKLLIKKS